MKKSRIPILKKCYECTYHQWYQVDSMAYQDAYSETYYAETSGKARYLFFMGLEVDSYNRSQVFTSIKVRRVPHLDMVENVRHPLADLVTKPMHDKAFHAIGSQATREPYRNRYVKEWDEDFEALIALGLAAKSAVETVVGGNLYYLNALGLEVIFTMQLVKRCHRLDETHYANYKTPEVCSATI